MGTKDNQPDFLLSKSPDSEPPLLLLSIWLELQGQLRRQWGRESNLYKSSKPIFWLSCAQ